jgi:hypothetical protein
VATFTYRVFTAPGTNASKIGETYAAFDGVSWRNAMDKCDDDGSGRVFLDMADETAAEMVSTAMETDDDVIRYTEL